MLNHETVNRLRYMKLTGMAVAFVKIEKRTR